MGFILMTLGILWKFVRSGATDFYFRKDESRLEEQSEHRETSYRRRLSCLSMGGTRQMNCSVLGAGRGEQERFRRQADGLGNQVDAGSGRRGLKITPSFLAQTSDWIVMPKQRMQEKE